MKLRGCTSKCLLALQMRTMDLHIGRFDSAAKGKETCLPISVLEMEQNENRITITCSLEYSSKFVGSLYIGRAYFSRLISNVG